jgi:hypothetical protein
MVVQTYNLGDQDFRTHLSRLKEGGVEAVINVGFEGETLATLKGMTELGLDVSYGTVADTISPDVISQFGNALSGGWSFGFRAVDDIFLKKLSVKLPDSEPAEQFAAALAYTHIKQMAQALSLCGDDLECASAEMDKAKNNCSSNLYAGGMIAVPLNIRLRLITGQAV